jgi:muramidase (phage lysozyme)
MAQMPRGEPFSVPDPLAGAWDAMVRLNRRLQAKNDPLGGHPAPPPLAAGTKQPYGDVKRVAASRYGAGRVLQMISQGEGTNRPDGYDLTFGYGRFTPPGAKKITDMTLTEVRQLQDEMLRRGSNSPVGKYQMTKDTLAQFAPALKLSGSEKFTPDVQDRLAREILHERGYDDFLQGAITASQLQARLAARWDGLSDLDGHPHSDRRKTAKRSPNVSNEDVQAAIKAAEHDFNSLFDDGVLPDSPGGWR